MGRKELANHIPLVGASSEDACGPRKYSGLVAGLGQECRPRLEARPGACGPDSFFSRQSQNRTRKPLITKQFHGIVYEDDGVLALFLFLPLVNWYLPLTSGLM